MIEKNNDENQVEIIAEKSRRTAYVFLALIGAGVIVAAAGIILAFSGQLKFKSEEDQAVVFSLLGAGAALIAVFSGLFIKQLYRPYALITLDGGELKFPDGTVCTPSEITGVEKSEKILTVTLTDRKIEVRGVVNCEKAYRKLCMLTGIPAEE